MTCDDIKVVNEHENRSHLGMDVILAVHDKHIRIHHP